MGKKRNIRRWGRAVRLLATAGIMSFLLTETGRGAGETGRAFLDAETIHDTWEANYARIESMQYALAMTQEPTAAREEPSRLTPYLYEERIEEGAHMWVLTSRDAATHAAQKIVSFDGEIGKHYTGGRRTYGQIHHGLSEAVEEEHNLMKFCLFTASMAWRRALPEPNHPSYELLRQEREDYPSGIPSLTGDYRHARQRGTVSVRPHLEMVSGQACHVLEIGGSGPMHEAAEIYWFAHERGMLAMKKARRNARGVETTNVEIKEIAKVNTDVGDIWYPRRTVIHSSLGSIQTNVVETFVPHIQPAPGTFDLDFPASVRVRDWTASPDLPPVSFSGPNAHRFYPTKGHVRVERDAVEYPVRLRYGCPDPNAAIGFAGIETDIPGVTCGPVKTSSSIARGGKTVDFVVPLQCRPTDPHRERLYRETVTFKLTTPTGEQALVYRLNVRSGVSALKCTPPRVFMLCSRTETETITRKVRIDTLDEFSPEMLPVPQQTDELSLQIKRVPVSAKRWLLSLSLQAEDLGGLPVGTHRANVRVGSQSKEDGSGQRLLPVTVVVTP